MQHRQQVSLVITVLNESETITELLQSIANQDFKPSETIIIDGGSADTTVQLLQDFAKKNVQFKIKVKTKKGNRSVGRNYGVHLAKSELIAFTDAGCVLKKSWLKELLTQYTKTKAPVIAGYYAAQTETVFQKAVVPYVLVMPDKVDPNTFLPATRSMLIEKHIFQKLDGFDVDLSDNEDYAFAKKLKKAQVKISFAKKAVVFWKPRKNGSEFYSMIFRFARGDFYAGIIRPKVIFIFIRYVLFFLLFAVSSKLFFAVLAFYCAWAIQKNKKYVADGYIYLPLLQIISDVAVLHGSIVGLFRRF